MARRWLRRRRSSLPTKPPYRSCSTSGAGSAGRAKTAGQIALMSGSPRAHSACRAACARSMPQRCASAGVSVFTLPTTMGDLFRCTDFTGRRVTPSGRSAVRVNRRVRISSAPRVASSRGSLARSQASSSFLFVGWLASGHMTARQPRSTGNMPETCRNGRAVMAVAGRRNSVATRSFLCKPSAKSNSLGLRSRMSRASAMVARTSDSASCAASCASPLALDRCSSLKLGLPSSFWGQTMPSGRSA